MPWRNRGGVKLALDLAQSGSVKFGAYAEMIRHCSEWPAFTVRHLTPTRDTSGGWCGKRSTPVGRISFLT